VPQHHQQSARGFVPGGEKKKTPPQGGTIRSRHHTPVASCYKPTRQRHKPVAEHARIAASTAAERRRAGGTDSGWESSMSDLGHFPPVRAMMLIVGLWAGNAVALPPTGADEVSVSESHPIRGIFS
jgi:hypothetical protein